MMLDVAVNYISLFCFFGLMIFLVATDKDL